MSFKSPSPKPHLNRTGSVFALPKQRGPGEEGPPEIIQKFRVRKSPISSAGFPMTPMERTEHHFGPCWEKDFGATSGGPFFQERKKAHKHKNCPPNPPSWGPALKILYVGVLSWKIKQKRPPHTKNWGSQIFMLGTPLLRDEKTCAIAKRRLFNKHFQGLESRLQIQN